MPHIIRLRGPWHIQPLARTRRLPDGSSEAVSGELPSAARTTVPSDWGQTLGPDFRGRVRYLRHFGRPTGIEDKRILLVVERVDALGTVVLNGQLLGEIHPLAEFRADVSGQLQPRNQLSIDVELPACDAASLPLERGDRAGLPGGLIGQVRLEITADFFGWTTDARPE